MSTDIQLSDILMTLPLQAQEPTGRADLTLRPDGAYLIPEGGAARPITPSTDLKFEASLRGDRLIVEGRSFLIPYGKSGRAQALIAEGRIRRLPPPTAHLPTPHPLFDGPSKLYRLWFERHLGADEIPLAFLDSGTEMPIPKAIAPKAMGPAAYYLTDLRQGLIAISNLGDVYHQHLPLRPLHTTQSVGRGTLQVGELTWLTTLGNGALYKEIAPLGGLERQARLFEAARGRHLAKDTARAKFLLEACDPTGAVPLARAYLDGALAHAREEGPNLDDSPLLAAIEVLNALPNPGGTLLAFTQGWDLADENAWALQGIIRGIHPSAALPLHRSLREGSLKGEGAIEGAVRDLDLAQHYLEAGALSDAQRLLEARLPKLPDESLMDLLPLLPTDLAEGRGGQALRIRLLDLLSEARGEVDVPDVDACRELARLQPLVPRRIRALSSVTTSPQMRAKCEEILTLLEGRWDEEPTHAPGPEAASYPLPPLSASMLEEHLQHPATQAGGAFDSLRLWLGKARVPDLSSVRNHAERLTPSISPEAFEALTDGLYTLGLPASIEAFVSRGQKRVGVRAYGGKRPFVLIGAAHLEEGDFHLTPSQLRFVIGAELVHLRFKHTRLTANEVWDGVFNMGYQVVDTSIALLGPLGILGKTLSGISPLKRAGDLIQGQLQVVRAGAEGAATIIGATRDFKPKKDDNAPSHGDHVHDSREELLAFCRALQLTADRGGLALGGDLRAAVGGMLRSQSNLLSALSAAQRLGLAPLLSRRDDQGKAIEQDLAVRLAALFSFYLSEDYAALKGPGS